MIIIGFLLFGIITAAVYISYKSFSNSNKYIKSWNFDEDQVGSFPSDWSGKRWGGTQIVAEKDGRFNVVEIHDTFSNKPVEFAIYFEELESGEVSFWIYGDTHETFTVWLCSGKGADFDHKDDIIIKFSRNLHISVFNEMGRYKAIKMYSNRHWYFCEVEFNCTKNAWKLWLDNYFYGEFQFYQQPNEINNLYFTTGKILDNTKFYVDDVKIEGILLD